MLKGVLCLDAARYTGVGTGTGTGPKLMGPLPAAFKSPRALGLGAVLELSRGKFSNESINDPTHEELDCDAFVVELGEFELPVSTGIVEFC